MRFAPGKVGAKVVGTVEGPPQGWGNTGRALVQAALLKSREEDRCISRLRVERSREVVGVPFLISHHDVSVMGRAMVGNWVRRGVIRTSKNGGEGVEEGQLVNITGRRRGLGRQGVGQGARRGL